MDQRQIDLVQSTFAQVVPIADTASQLFYDELFTLDPSLRPLFKSDLTEQRKKLMTMLGLAVDGLDDWQLAAEVVRGLGARHASYGVRPEHFDTVGAALHSTLAKGLGDAFTPEVEEAWTACYVLVSTEMKDAMAGASA
jgi:hemoglobin-like flavoprotein